MKSIAVHFRVRRKTRTVVLDQVADVRSDGCRLFVLWYGPKGDQRLATFDFPLMIENVPCR